MSSTRRRKCRHYGQLYDPDPRNRYHQRYCGQPACRQASKAASQRTGGFRPRAATTSGARPIACGCEATNHYYYYPLDLAEKVINAQDLLSKLNK